MNIPLNNNHDSIVKQWIERIKIQNRKDIQKYNQNCPGLSQSFLPTLVINNSQSELLCTAKIENNDNISTNYVNQQQNSITNNNPIKTELISKEIKIDLPKSNLKKSIYNKLPNNYL